MALVIYGVLEISYQLLSKLASGQMAVLIIYK